MYTLQLILASKSKIFLPYRRLFDSFAYGSFVYAQVAVYASVCVCIMIAVFFKFVRRLDCSFRLLSSTFIDTLNWVRRVHMSYMLSIRSSSLITVCR